MSAPDPSDDFSVELTDEWASSAKRTEASADERVQRYSAISRAHENAKPPRSWTPASSGSSSATSSQTWIKVTAIVLIAIAVLAVLSLLRALG